MDWGICWLRLLLKKKKGNRRPRGRKTTEGSRESKGKKGSQTRRRSFTFEKCRLVGIVG